MRHLGDLSETEMPIDHFDPRRKKDYIQRYCNLYLADSHCNSKKGDTWPSKTLRDQGVRFLDCCSETDYGKVIFEDPTTHELVGTTGAAKYHIRQLGLNDKHLISQRRERARLRRKFYDMPVEIIGPEFRRALDLAEAMRDQIEKMIPPIPPPT